MRYCDVLVVGGGPAGSAAAAEAAKLGAETIIAEKQRTVGEPVRCAEFVPLMLLRELDIPAAAVSRSTTGMKTFLPGGEEIVSSLPGVMLHRNLFDQALAEYAAGEGAKLITGARCTEYRRGEVIMSAGSGEISIVPRVIIGADGPASTVGKWMGSVNKDFIIGLQYELPLAKPLEHTEIHFRHEFYGGYGWLFPKEHTARVGIGVRLSKPLSRRPYLRSLLAGFAESLAKQGKVKGDPLSFVSGLIPCGGPLRTVKDAIVLAGDAAGQTHAITGGGVPQAVLCGKMAGRAAARAAAAGSMELLQAYEKEWQLLFHDELARARKKRQLLESQWDTLDAVVKKTWVIFREYYREG
ncbi:MAG: NAD(P)/FAD-dependent oxidoreductase [Candidatus Eremiobacteraeota bacterium]|nr:NAD(P)/FAD-dependent oxidoreductase [Candidatus Eremiobacteraeota bacterium]